jgi:hypothetical protein
MTKSGAFIKSDGIKKGEGNMEEKKVKVHSGPAIRPDESEQAKPEDLKNIPHAAYYIFKALLVLLKLSVVLILIFSMQNIADIVRIIPYFNSLTPGAAFGFSYLFIQIFCIYIYIIYLGSVPAFFRELLPTIMHIRGIILLALAGPVGFALLSGSVWWISSRGPLFQILAVPFQILPDLIKSFFDRGGYFILFIAMTLLLLLVLMVPVLLFQKIFKKMRPV